MLQFCFDLGQGSKTRGTDSAISYGIIFWMFLVSTIFLHPSACLQLGELSYDASTYIEFYSGTLPIVLTAPHGGSQEPEEIADRSCFGCNYNMDVDTELVAKMLAEALYNKLGCHAHLVVNSLHRKKLDANRDIGEAADGDPTSELAWIGFHDFIETAKLSFNNTNPGLVIDVHGQSHPIARIELGYLLTATDLSKSDTELDGEADTTSIFALATKNPPLSSLVRGPQAFGTLLENTGFAAVPSQQQPSLGFLEGFFSGGYITNRHGSVNGGVVDAFQMEMGRDLRTQEDQRNAFAPAFADVVVEYFTQWYDMDEEQLRSFCREEETPDDDDDDLDDDNDNDDGDSGVQNGVTKGMSMSGKEVAGLVIGLFFVIVLCCMFCTGSVIVVAVVVHKNKSRQDKSVEVEL